MADEIGWELYRSFLGVLEQGSLSGAARALDLTQPTVGRHVAALEQALGLVLFTRTQTGVIATDAALELRGHAETMRSSATALRRAAEGHGAGVSGTVRISASEVIGVEVLPPIVAALQAAHPALKIELVMTNRVQDLLRREADVAVRMTRPTQELLVTKKVGHVPLGLHAHKRYLAQRGTPRTLDELAEHTLIGHDEETPFLRAARKALPVWSRTALSIRTDSDLGQLAMIRAGAGIGICQVAVARRDPSLVRVLPKAFEHRLETWITMHSDLRQSRRCKVTFDALVTGLTAHAA